MQIMIFSRELGIEQPQKPVVRRGGHRKDSKTGMPKQLGEEEVVVANPPVVEAHGESQQLHGAICEEWDNGDVEDFLLGVGVEGEEWVGVLGEMVSTVEFPE